MSPQPKAIGHYRITGKLGAGDMGEVWRATDSKLGREVAAVNVSKLNMVLHWSEELNRRAAAKGQ